MEKRPPQPAQRANVRRKADPAGAHDEYYLRDGHAYVGASQQGSIIVDFLKVLAPIALIAGMMFGAKYLVAAPASSPASEVATTPPAPSVGKWQVSRHRDAITDERFASLVLPAEANPKGYGKHPYFMLRCENPIGWSEIAWHAFLGSETSYSNWRDDTFRFGDAAPVDANWMLNEDETATQYLDGRQIAATLRKVDNFVARITPYREGPMTLTFDVRGLTEALKQARPECNMFLRDEAARKQSTSTSTSPATREKPDAIAVRSKP